jgi:hypothetical protein
MMSKKSITLVLIFMIVISMLVTNVFAQGVNLNANQDKGRPEITGSDRDRNNIQEVPAKQKQEHPFKAEKSKKTTVDEEPGAATTITVSNPLISMTEVRTIDVVVDLGYVPNLEDLKWTFGDRPFSDWKRWVSGSNYTGPQIINFVEQPRIEDNTVVAKIRFNLLYNTTNLSGNARSQYPTFIGYYDLKVEDTTNGTTASKTMKYYPYDSYHTYDEIKPALDDIFTHARKGRYLEYQSIGQSVQGRDLHFVILAKDKASVNKYLNNTLPMMLENPSELKQLLESGKLGEYKVPIFINNIHPDEAPGIDAQIDTLRKLVTEDVIEYNTLDENNKSMAVSFSVDDMLDNVIILMNITQNPDGRANNTRGNVNGFDLNRDNGYQTQIETQIVTSQIAKWSPISFLDLHGFVAGFLIEPCTPPHEPNFEYDLLVESMLENAHAMGKAGISNTTYNSYLIPRLDYGQGWDDATIAYTAMYAMMHGALGYTIEMPHLNQESNNLMVYTLFSGINYVRENKDRLFANQLEIYRRGIEGIDSREVDRWLVNARRESIGRPRGDNENFFPDYYVLPLDLKLQKNALEVYNTVEYLLRNGIKVEKTLKSVNVEGVTYPAGSYVVNMKQAKRGYANTVFYQGINVSDFSNMYAEIVLNFPALRGFDAYAIRTEGAFNKVTENVPKVNKPQTQVTGNAAEFVVRNTNNDVIKAVNKLLNEGKTVKQVQSAGKGYAAGDYIISRKDLMDIRKDYYLEVTTFDAKAEAKVLVEPKIAFYGSNQTKFVLNELGFNLVPIDQSNIIIADNGTNVKGRILDEQKSYIGIGINAVNFIRSQNVLPGFNWAYASSSHEGLMKGIITQNHFITSGYAQEDLLYTAHGAYITAVPTGAQVISKVSTADDFFVSGWWPNNNNRVKGQVMAITQEVGDARVTVFANSLTNKAHPQHNYRMLANTIYGSTNK